jgi:hypothetical protein
VEPVTPLRHDPIPQHQAGSVGPLMRLACTCGWQGGWEATAAAMNARPMPATFAQPLRASWTAWVAFGLGSATVRLKPTNQEGDECGGDVCGSW